MGHPITDFVRNLCRRSNEALWHLESMDRLLYRETSPDGRVAPVCGADGVAPSFSLDISHLSVDDGTKRLSQRFLPGYSLSLQPASEDSIQQAKTSDISSTQWKWLISRQKDRIRFQKKKLGLL